MQFKAIVGAALLDPEYIRRRRMDKDGKTETITIYSSEQKV